MTTYTKEWMQRQRTTIRLNARLAQWTRPRGQLVEWSPVDEIVADMRLL